MRFSVVLVAIGLLAVGVVDSAHGRTWQVAQDGSGDFTVIQEAVNAASSGDVIHIGPGRYIDYTIFDWGNVYVWLDGTKSLTFVGAGAEATIIGPDVYASGWTDYGVACDNGDVTIRIENLRIENQNYIGLSMFNSVLELIGCIVERCFLVSTAFRISNAYRLRAASLSMGRIKEVHMLCHAIHRRLLFAMSVLSRTLGVSILTIRVRSTSLLRTAHS